MYKSKMGEKEREYRSRVNQYIGGMEIVRGNLVMRLHTCGKINCRCVTKGEKHKSLYISRSNKGRMEQQYISKDKEAQIKQWTKHYQEIQKLLEKISDIYWNRLKKGE